MGITVILIIVEMLMLNILFAAYELAVASVSPGRLELLLEQRKRNAMSALAINRRMAASLAVMQIGITPVDAITAATGRVGAKEIIPPWIEQCMGISPCLA